MINNKCLSACHLSLCVQVAAWLQCKKRAAAVALTSASSGAYADVDDASLDTFAVALLGEWLSPRRLAELQTACGIDTDAKGLLSLIGPHTVLPR